MRHAARWSVLIASLLILAWVVLSGSGPEAPKGPPLPTRSSKGVHP